MPVLRVMEQIERSALRGRTLAYSMLRNKQAIGRPNIMTRPAP